MSATLTVATTSIISLIVAAYSGIRAWRELGHARRVKIKTDKLEITIKSNMPIVSLDDIYAAIAQHTDSSPPDDGIGRLATTLTISRRQPAGTTSAR